METIQQPIILEELGKIYGRDAIFLDKIEFENTKIVKLTGEFNASLCENLQKDSKYELTFHGILAFNIIELDFFDLKNYTSSFEKVINSQKLIEFKKSSQGHFKVKNTHQHYIFHTYDDIIEVIASDFKLILH